MKRRLEFFKNISILLILISVVFFLAGCNDLENNHTEQPTTPTKTEVESSAPQETQTTPIDTTPELDPNGKYIALTFDDGPSPESTQRLLAILEEKEVKATFFVLGQSALTFPETLKSIHDKGHEIANHTYDHTILTQEHITVEDIRYQIDTTNEIIEQITGTVPTSFRPPQGAYNENVRNVAKERGLAIYHWSWESCPEDWKYTDPNYIASHVIENAANGHIVLLHDTNNNTVDAVSDMIDGLKQRGFEFLTVSDLAKVGPDGEAIPGKVYFYNFTS